MEIFNQILSAQSFELRETIYYYKNRPLPFSEIWINEPNQIALIIDHGLCQQPVCGATWSYLAYVEKQNKINQSYRWLRYDAGELDSLRDDLSILQECNQFQRIDKGVSIRKNHPQLIGKSVYRKQLRESRKEMSGGKMVKFIVSL